MSTILATLKKLEEDKKSLDKNLDLKDLVLREDQNTPAVKKLELTQNNIIALVFIGVLIGWALVWGFKPAILKEVAPSPQVPLVQKPPFIEKHRPETTVGIPLSNISDTEYRQRFADKENLPSVIETSPLPNPPIGKLDTKPVPLEVNEIRDMIQAAKLSVEQPQVYAYPDESATRGIAIPGLKVKGIIFFSAKSPSNHIFISTSTSKNKKVRIGDTVQSATLMHIESNRVVFSYQGEMVHLRIGE
jgi:hypothetical protein